MSLATEQSSDVFERAGEDGAGAALDDGALEEVGVFDHVGDEFVVGEVGAGEVEFAVDGLGRAQEVAGPEAGLANQLAQLRLRERRGVVVDLLVFDAALTEQPGQLAALASSRLFVDGDFVRHVFQSPFQGKMPRTRVASATRATARA